VHSEYGILEIEENNKLSSSEKVVGTLIGTSLHNLAMPFIRYKIDDVIEVDRHKKACVCGRGMPLVNRLYGRSQDVIITKEGKYLTNVFVCLNYLKGISWAQLIQESLCEFKLRIIKDDNFDYEFNEAQVDKLRRLIGREARIISEFLDFDDLHDEKTKYRPVISKLSNDLVASSKKR